MAQENVDIVHRLNEAWNQGGLEQLPVFDAAPDVAERVHARMGALTDDGHTVSSSKRFSADEAERVGEQIGIDWETVPFDVEQFRAGMDVELEHGTHDPATNVTDDDPTVTGKIALAHLNEFPDYYTRLQKMEAEAEQQP